MTGAARAWAALLGAALLSGCAAGRAPAPPRIALAWVDEAPPVDPRVAAGPQPEPYEPGARAPHRKLRISNLGDAPVVVVLAGGDAPPGGLAIPAGDALVVDAPAALRDPRRLVASLRAAPPPGEAPAAPPSALAGDDAGPFRGARAVRERPARSQARSDARDAPRAAATRASAEPAGEPFATATVLIHPQAMHAR